jgi:hypothetical protein
LLNDLRLGRKEPNMMIIGVDYHPSFQTIAFFIEETGECGERELNHSRGEAESFYRDLKQQGISVRVGMCGAAPLSTGFWALNPRAYSELAPFGKRIGLLFLSLAAALAIASTGWLKRRRWGWQLALVIVGTQVLWDIRTFITGASFRGWWVSRLLVHSSSI